MECRLYVDISLYLLYLLCWYIEIPFSSGSVDSSRFSVDDNVFLAGFNLRFDFPSTSCSALQEKNQKVK